LAFLELKSKKSIRENKKDNPPQKFHPKQSTKTHANFQQRISPKRLPAANHGG
jgi:hypothetical protein